MLNSIRTRLILSHLAVIAVAMALAAFLLLSSLQRYFTQSMEDSLLAQAHITAQTLIPGSLAAGPAASTQAALANTLQQRAPGGLALQAQNLGVPQAAAPAGNFDLTYLSDASLQLSSQLATRIRILDTRGTVLLDSASGPQSPGTTGGRGASLQDDPLVARALQGRYASRVQPGDGAAPGAMQVALPVTKDGRLVAVVYLSQALSDLAAVLNDVRGRLLLSAAIALALSGLLGLALAQTIARPIRRLTSAAEAVAQGHLDQRVTVAGRDELSRLGRTFNEMTARLAEARQMQVDFVANVSHELRTPLTSLKGLVESLRDGAVDDLAVRDRFLQTMEDETNRLIRLVNDLLTLSRADSQALALRLQAVDVAQALDAAAACLAPAAAARQVTLANPAAAGLAVMADPDRLGQVLNNLIANAVQYSQPGGAVCLDAERIPGSNGAWVRITVRDHGIGIPAEALPHVGERFYRADRARSRAAGGSGLGLAIARALVAAHGGQLQIASVEGAGTTVSFTLPAADIAM